MGPGARESPGEREVDWNRFRRLPTTSGRDGYVQPCSFLVFETFLRTNQSRKVIANTDFQMNIPLFCLSYPSLCLTSSVTNIQVSGPAAPSWISLWH